MRTDTRDILTIDDANHRGISRLVRDADEGRTTVLTRHGKPKAVVTSTETIDRMEGLEELVEDLQLSVLALARIATDSGDRYDLDAVLAEVGIDPAELDDGDSED